MKTSKKLLAFAICLVMVAMLIPMSALAVDPLTIDSVNVTDTTPGDGLKNVTVNYTATNLDQVTILALIGTATLAPTTYDNNTIAYIDQQAGTLTSFTYVIDENKFNATNNTMYIKMGGTALGSAVNSDPVTVVEAVVGHTVSGSLTGVMYIFDSAEFDQETKDYIASYNEKMKSSVELYGFDTNGDPYVVKSIDKLTPAASGDTTANFSLAGIEDGTYFLLINRVGCMSSMVDVNMTGSDLPVGELTLSIGDANGDGSIDFNDVTTVLTAITNGDTADGNPACDINSDGSVDFNDITALISLIN